MKHPLRYLTDLLTTKAKEKHLSNEDVNDTK